MEVVSDGKLSSSVLELAQTLTRYNQELTERTAEKDRMSKILAEFRKHTAWQGQRKQLMRRNQERLFNESSWLESKTTEVWWQPSRRKRHRGGPQQNAHLLLALLCALATGETGLSACVQRAAAGQGRAGQGAPQPLPAASPKARSP